MPPSDSHQDLRKFNQREPRSESRRLFFRRSVAIVPIASLAACDSSSAPTGTSAMSARARADVDAYRPRYFNSYEWRFVQAACSRLIPGDSSDPGALEAGVPEYIDRQMDTPWAHGALWYMQGPFSSGAPELGYQGRLSPREIYRLGIAAVDRHCIDHERGRFSTLAAGTQELILRSLERGAIDLQELSGSTFFALVLQNVREGFFCDPIHGGNKAMAGWKMIGFPGARADFMDWVTRYGEAYPFGPVDIDGDRR